MARTIDLKKLKTATVAEIDQSKKRIDGAIQDKLPYWLLRWMCQMTAVEVHQTWERYVEMRLIAGLNHDPRHFIAAQNIKGVKHISYGLATYVVRGGNRYFDFRSMGELIDKADKWLAKKDNMFRALPASNRDYIDTLSAIRNCVVHRSDAAIRTYKKKLRQAYGIRSAPEPGEFLYAKDSRATSPARYEIRLYGLMAVVRRSVLST
jgi:hypothetical protein